LKYLDHDQSWFPLLKAKSIDSREDKKQEGNLTEEVIELEATMQRILDKMNK
jgi:hypothetical protein